MSIPKRNAKPGAIRSTRRTFHVNSSTVGKRSIFQMETLARLLIDVFFHYRNEGDYRLHAFVVMRDHFHALLTIEGKGTIENAVGRIKGGFSYRAKRELGFTKEIWQPGFTDERVRSTARLKPCPFTCRAPHKHSTDAQRLFAHRRGAPVPTKP